MKMKKNTKKNKVTSEFPNRKERKGVKDHPTGLSAMSIMVMRILLRIVQIKRLSRKYTM